MFSGAQISLYPMTDDFVDVILGRAENEAPPECGLRTIQLSEAAWKSAMSSALRMAMMSSSTMGLLYVSPGGPPRPPGGTRRGGHPSWSGSYFSS